MNDLFVSYSRSDRPWVEVFVAALKEENLSVFWDQFIHTGSNWRDRLESELSNSRLVIVVWTKASVKSEFVKEEAQRAMDRNKLFPVRLVDPQEIPLGFGGRQALDLREWNESNQHPSFTAMMEEVRNALSSSVATRPQSLQEKGDSASFFPPGCKQFVSAKLTGRELMDFDIAAPPYAPPLDPTDDCAYDLPSAVSAVLWMPRSDFFRRKELPNFTAACFVCSPSIVEIGNSFVQVLGEDRLAKDLNRAPSAIYKENKQYIIPAIRDVLRNSFVVVPAFPKELAEIGRERPALLYRAMMDMVLLPLVKFHSIRGIPEFDCHLADLGDEKTTRSVIRDAKAIVKTCYRNKGNVKGDSFGEDAVSCVVFMAKVYAWAVNQAYNQENKKWLRMLES